MPRGRTRRVQNVDAIIARAVDLGGSVVQPARDMPGPSRLGVIADPFGAPLALISVGG
ncbi:VOC family protein [Nocardia inohanensis]|uniref:VOC family protein n=1 Tax=Nocardia inohanensis TaxID=209246 RepID=UPI000A844344|nr:VOC family protein [Nocardia inohanensis]